MAEIKIQRKKSRAWIWLLLLLVAVVLIWLYFDAVDNDIDEAENEYGTETVVEEEGYVMFLDTLDTDVSARSDEMQQFVDAEVEVQNYYVLNGLRSLASSLNAIVNNQDITDPKLRAERNDLDRFITDIDEDTTDTRLYKKAITNSVGLMQSIQQKKYPDMKAQVDSVVNSAEQIDGSVPFEEQQEQVKEFFDLANNVLQEMRKDYNEPEPVTLEE